MPSLFFYTLFFAGLSVRGGYVAVPDTIKQMLDFINITVQYNESC